MTADSARVWRPRRAPNSASTPAGLASWLDEPGSLTRRLRRVCGEGPEVALLRQRWGQAWRDEWRRLGLRPGRRVWVREVLLCCGATPWVYARTLIPESVLQGQFRRLRQLDRRPLGQVLFGRYPLCRGPIEVARIAEGDGLWSRVADQADEGARLWARRSVFRVAHRPLLVTEVFLPALGRHGLGRVE